MNINTMMIIRIHDYSKMTIRKHLFRKWTIHQ